MTDSESCHRSYAEGCTDSARANTYDAFLNFLKNQKPRPSTVESVKTFDSLAGWLALDKAASDLGIGKSRQADYAQELADLGQGNFYTLVGYLYFAQPGGIETCNCKAKNPDDRDFHLGIGFEPDVAADIANGTLKAKTGKGVDPLKQTSVVVEMTPHFRDEFHPNWSLTHAEAAAGRYVKVVGQLLLDNEHNVPEQNCAFPNRDLKTCWRVSAWELHPVTMRFSPSLNSLAGNPGMKITGLSMATPVLLGHDDMVEGEE